MEYSFAAGYRRVWLYLSMKKIIILLFCSVFFACSEKEVEAIPDTVLSKEKMAEVLVDVHLMEASMNVGVNPEMLSSVTGQAGIDIFKRHGITKEQYQESFIFYSQNPQLLAEVYQLVLNALSKMQAEEMNKP